MGYDVTYLTLEYNLMGSCKLSAPALAQTNSSSTLELRRARQKHGISLEQVIEKTKICMRYLLAIESEEFTQIPGGVFALNYLRQYAEASGFDGDLLIRYYGEKMNPQPKADPPVAEKLGPSDVRGLVRRLFRVPA